MNRSEMRPLSVELWIRSLTTSEIHRLIDDVKQGEADAISRAVAFVTAESLGYWHNRARAKLCRYFKNHRPSDDECAQLVHVVVKRLTEGRFAQQFKEQLSMAIRFAPDHLDAAASVAITADRAYIRRQGRWVQHVLATSSMVSRGE